MSYEIVRSIGIKKDKVMISCDSNNVYPKDFKSKECEFLTRILKESGREAVEKEILIAYLEGNFQEGIPNNYSLASDTFEYHLTGYEIYELHSDDEKKKKAHKALYEHYLNVKNRIKGKFIVCIPKDVKGNFFDNDSYLFKYRKNQGWYYTTNKNDAKIFKSELELNTCMKHGRFSDDYKIERI